MTAERHQELWRRLLDQGLDAREELELWRALEADPDLREQALHDYALDSQLRSFHQIDQSTNDFVLEVMNRLPHDSQLAEPPVAEVVAADLETSGVAAPPVSQARRTNPPAPSRLDSSFQAGVNWYVVAGAMGAVVALLLIAVMVAMPASWQATRQEQTQNADGRTTHRERLTSPVVKPRRDLTEDVASQTDRVERSPENDPKDALVGDPRERTLPETESSESRPLPESRREIPTPEIVEQRPEAGSAPAIVQEPTAPPEESLVTTPIARSETPLPVAALVREEHAVWQQRPDKFLADQPLKLLAGEAELSMLAGAQVTLKAPVTFELDSANQVKLTSGRLHAVVPPQAVGFTVETPASQVVDLGTEFDVTVDEQGATGVQVQRGEVELTTKPAAGQTPQQWKLQRGKTKWVAADGEDFDWVMTIRINPLGTGAIEVDGRRMEFVGNSSQARARMLREFNALSRKLPTRSNSRKAMRAMIDVNGHSITVRTREELQVAQQVILRQVITLDDTLERMRQMQQALPNAFQIFDFEEMKRGMQEAQQRGMQRANEIPNR